MARRNGKTTRCCQAVALYLAEDPTRRAVIVGPYVIRNKHFYQRLLFELGVDMHKVTFTSTQTERLHGASAVFCDDRFDYPYAVWHELMNEVSMIEKSGGFVYWGEYK